MTLVICIGGLTVLLAVPKTALRVGGAPADAAH